MQMATTWAILLLCLTAVVSAQPPEDRLARGEDDLGEGAEVGGDGDGDGDGEDMAPPPRAMVMKPIDVQGLGIIGKFQAQNKKLITEEKSLRLKLASPPEEQKGIAYVEVPGYKYDYQGRTIEEKSRAECELVCSTYSACKSYSYNKEKRECIWSMSHIHYNPAFTMWAKMLTPDGHFHTHMYGKMPGMLLQDKLKRPLKDISFDECKYDCTKDESCKSFSFSEDKQECVKSGVPVHFAEGWNYYEKDIPIKDPDKSGHKKEAKRKAKEKADWIKSSTSADRDAIEKDTKLTENLQHAREVAEDAERIEKASRREMNYNQKKCMLFSGMAANKVKQNMRVMGIVSKQQLKEVKLMGTQEKMAKNVKFQVTKEGLQKAKLEAKLSSERFKEAQQKLKEVKGVEAETKLVLKDSQARKKRACEKDRQTQSYFAGKEKGMKNSEAEAKRIQNKKDMLAATDEWKKAASQHAVKDTMEKKIKKQVEVEKMMVEGAQKRETNGEHERDKKIAMDEKEKFETALHVAESKNREAKRQALVTQEKLEKAKGNRDDMKEKGDKARKIVAAREKEMITKTEERRKAKLEEIKKEKENKEQVNKKKKKSEELSKKRELVQAASVNNIMEQLKADEQTERVDTAKKEKDESSVESAQESSKQAEEKRVEGLKEVQDQEAATKKKVQEEHTRTQNLLQQLKNSQKEAEQAQARDKAAAEANRMAVEKEKKAAEGAKRAQTEQDRAKLATEEANWKQESITTSHSADSAAAQKTMTAMQQQAQADNLQAKSCIAVCMEGMHVNAQKVKIEKEEKLMQKAAAVGEFGGGEEMAELGQSRGDVDQLALLQTDWSPMQSIQSNMYQPDSPPLIPDEEQQMGESSQPDTCDPGLSATSEGACGASVSAQILNDACQKFSGTPCEAICEQKAESVKSAEASCKTNMKDPTQAQVESAPMPEEGSPPIPDAKRALFEEAEKNRKESKVKADNAKPVPYEIHPVEHEAFTYKGCDC